MKLSKETCAKMSMSRMGMVNNPMGGEPPIHAGTIWITDGINRHRHDPKKPTPKGFRRGMK